MTGGRKRHRHVKSRFSSPTDAAQHADIFASDINMLSITLATVQEFVPEGRGGRLRVEGDR